MSVLPPRSQFISLLCGLALGVPALAQQPVAESPLQVNPCSAVASVLSQQQDGDSVTLAIEVAVEDCKGICTGSVEYDLVFLDEDQQEIRWHLTRPWSWREATERFTLDISEKAAPEAMLQTVDNLTIGRCSCSVSRPFGT